MSLRRSVPELLELGILHLQKMLFALHCNYGLPDEVEMLVKYASSIAQFTRLRQVGKALGLGVGIEFLQGAGLFPDVIAKLAIINDHRTST
jgi:hypothetical protein